MTSPRERRAAYIAWAAICLIWGTTYLGIRVCLETMPPGLMGGLRWLAAGIVLTGIVHSEAGRRRLLASRIPVCETWDLTGAPIDMLAMAVLRGELRGVAGEPGGG